MCPGFRPRDATLRGKLTSPAARRAHLGGDDRKSGEARAIGLPAAMRRLSALAERLPSSASVERDLGRPPSRCISVPSACGIDLPCPQLTWAAREKEKAMRAEPAKPPRVLSIILRRLSSLGCWRLGAGVSSVRGRRSSMTAMLQTVVTVDFAGAPGRGCMWWPSVVRHGRSSPGGRAVPGACRRCRARSWRSSRCGLARGERFGCAVC